MRILAKKLVRDIGRSRGQAAAVAAVMLCGIASQITFAGAHRNLLLTRDSYYATYRLADFFIMLERAPESAVFRIEQLPGVRDARGRIVQDVSLDVPGFKESRTGRLISMPDTPRPVINDLVLLSGRYFDPEALNETILSDAFAKANNLAPGDLFRANINNRKYTLRVVGTALSPEYVYLIRGPEEMVPNPERFGILWVPQSFAEMALDMEGACNDIVGVVDDPAQLEAILDSAEKLLDGFGVFVKIKREDQISNRFLSDEIQGLSVSAKIMPAVFLGVAALVLLVLLNRMVRHERTQIGLLKAYGYSNWAVAGHYVQYALVLCLAGCLGGIVVGQLLQARLLGLYVQFYSFPMLRSSVYPGLVGQAMGLSIAAAVLGALSAARHAIRIQPAESMRAESPRTAHRTLTERIPAVWTRLGFTGRMIVRNVSRYRWRAALTVLGVMIASGNLFLGWFMIDIVNYFIDFQYQVVQREDMRVLLEAERGSDALDDLRQLRGVVRAEPFLMYPFEIRSGWRTKDVSITGVPPDSQLLSLRFGKQYEVGVREQGIILDERLAQQLGVKAGDMVHLKPLLGRITRERDVPVVRLVREYVGLNAYMSLPSLSGLLDESLATNMVLLRVLPGSEKRISEELKDIAAVAGVLNKSEAYASMQDTLAQNMQIMNIFSVVFSGVIAFAVIYNSTMVSLAERERELASLRVLGFTIAEVGRIVYYENYLLSGVGLVLGIPFGAALCAWLVRAYTTDLFRFPYHVERSTFVLTIIFTVAFVALANLSARRKVLALDMVEVLKSRE